MLNPLSIAHLGIARRPIIAALLGMWDELMEVLSQGHGGSGGERSKPDNESRKREAAEYRDQEEITAIINALALYGILT